MESSQSGYASVNYALNTPQDVTATLDDNDFVVHVSWSAVKHAKCYRVSRSKSKTGTYTILAESLTTTSWTDPNPMIGDNYYKVEAFYDDMKSDMSNYAYVKCTFNAPQNVTASLDDNELVINVSWSAVKYAKSYKVFRSNSSSGTYTLVAENITTTSWTDPNPMIGDNYYKVEAFYDDMKSDLSNYAYVKCSFDAPQNVTATPNHNVVNVSWSAVKYAKSYKVFRSNSSSGSYTLVAENISTTTWTDTNPLVGSNYYKVSAVCGELESSKSGYAYVKFEKPLCPDGNHPHMIDLGLPDGTKWACCNVGATSPESYGGYYAWGETEEKDLYDWSTYLYCNGSNDTLTKYSINNSYNYGYNGFTDGLTELLPEDDAATANWGSSWRMPTYNQMEELINSKYTTTEWTTLNGVKGRKITSNSNGNSIFLPAAGYRSDASLKGVGAYGYYWSRSLITNISSCACRLYFDSGSVDKLYSGRYYGQSVRPVRVQN